MGRITTTGMSVQRQYFCSIIASFGCVCAGTVLAWTSPALIPLRTDLNISETEGGIVGSTVAVGAIFSSLPAGYLADKLGRRALLSYLTLPFVIGWALIAIGNDVKVIYLGRLLGGIASGAVCVCVPVYVSEIASVSVRGILGSFFQMSFCLGILLANVMGAVLDWRYLCWALCAFPVVYFGGLCLIPEPPKITSEKVQLQPQEGKQRGSLLKGRNFHALKVALGLVTFQQLSGVNAVIFYTSGIFTAAGTSFSPAISAIIVASVQLVFSCISVALIEKLDRRLYLIVSSIGMSISLVLLGAYFHSKLMLWELPALVPLFSLILFIVSFCAGFGPIPWLMMSEIFAADVKGSGCGVATMFNWSLVCLVTASFPPVCAALGEHLTFYMFALLNLAAAFFALYCVPETRGKTSDEIQACL